MKTDYPKNTISIGEARSKIANILSKNCKRRLSIIDTSGSSSYGYAFSVIIEELDPVYSWLPVDYDKNKPICTSQTYWSNSATNRLGRSGAFSSRFDEKEIQNSFKLLNK